MKTVTLTNLDRRDKKPKLYKEMFVALVSPVLCIADSTRTLKSQDLSIMEMTMTT